MTRVEAQVAAAVGAQLGLPVGRPVVLHDGSNVVVELAPTPVVARVAALTARARPAPVENLAREVALAAALAAGGAPVLPPTAITDPGPHAADGLVLSLWPLIDVAGHAVGEPALVAAALASVHDVASRLDLADTHPGGWPGLSDVVADAAGALRAAQGWLGAEAVDILWRRHDVAASTAATADAAGSAGTPGGRRLLHGDAHPRNLLHTGEAVLWCDLEDTVVGPLEWDLAVVARSPHHDGAAALDAYRALTGYRPDADVLEAMTALRSWQAACWGVLFADAFPSRRAQVLASLTSGGDAGS